MFPFLYKMFPFYTKCFQVISDLGTRFSAMDKMCLTSMQLTQYNLDLFQPILAENMALINSNWKTPQKAFFRAISGLQVFLMAPFTWKRPPSSTRTSKNRIGDRLGQNSDVSKKFPWILKCFHLCTKCFQVITDLGNLIICNGSVVSHLYVLTSHQYNFNYF